MRSVATVVALALLTASGVARADDDPTPFWASPDPDHRLASHAESWEVPTLHALGLMTGMRISLAIMFPDPFANDDLFDWAGHYGESLRNPPTWDRSAEPFEWDGDSWPINVVGHGLFGSELYLRSRTCRASLAGALAFATAQSAVWEYIFEGNAHLNRTHFFE